MKHKSLVLLLLLFLTTITLVAAKDITLTMQQKEYYFTVNEQAIINLTTDNSYDEQIEGILHYTIRQTINQGNIQYSNSNAESITFSIPKEKTILPLDFGTSNTPTTIQVDLEFSYTNKEVKSVSLNNIIIYFVAEESQKQNQQQETTSTSQKQKEPIQQEPNSLAEQEQKLQNNQIPQDSSALKQEMNEQIQKEKETEEAFQKQLAQNKEFQKEHQELLQEGYELTDAKLEVENNNTGNFSLQYQKETGEEASIKGEMKNGTMEQMQKETPESREQALETLQQNKKFQKYEQQLKEEGYEQQEITYSQEKNTTSIQINYTNQEKKTAMITAEVNNKTAQQIELINTNKEKKQYAWIIILSVISIISYALYKKNYARSLVQELQENKKITPFDYKKISKDMLKQAEQLFTNNKHKNAYGLIGQSLRLYLSHHHNLKKELTNDEILHYLQKNKIKYSSIKKCFDISALVSFAKYPTNKKDFTNLLFEAESILSE